MLPFNVDRLQMSGRKITRRHIVIIRLLIVKIKRYNTKNKETVQILALSTHPLSRQDYRFLITIIRLSMAKIKRFTQKQIH